jgi:L-threonylcarbamoyladenylate synthase
MSHIRVPTTAAIADAAAVIRAGGLVGMPTETVYGLAADATSGSAVAGIYAAKDRPRFNPLIVHVADRAEAERIGVFDDRVRALADAFWPGPLTLVVPYRPEAGISDLARAGLDTVALRVPAHPVALALLKASGRPLAAPSANRSGRISPTTAAAVAEELGAACPLILDGGPCPVGLESTIVDATGETLGLLRPGGIPRESLASFGLSALALPYSGHIKAPGALHSHYAPRAMVRLDALQVVRGEAVLDFGCALAHIANKDTLRIDLSRSANLTEAATTLFSALRALDATGAAVIAVAPIPRIGLGEAINDRLARAAADRVNNPGDRPAELSE